ncbi:MAG: hypothetical protein HKN45_05175 [Flavobacteriales bacterium]|nr:hypothetical protein [Flavobacteriales bacterium]
MIQRLTITLTVFLCSLGTSAQIDLSKFSASLRTKMAEEEQLASEQDPVFQELMAQGVKEFENNEFEEAIQRFEEAGNRRPINVYPPVMIADVELAKANYVEEEPEPEAEEVPEENKEPELTTEERVELMYQRDLAKVYDKLPPKPKEKEPDPIEEPEERDAEGLLIIEKEVNIEKSKDDEIPNSHTPETNNEIKIVKETPRTESLKKNTEEESNPTQDAQAELGKEFPDGVTEEVFQEGNRTITRRIVVKDRIGNEYRRVKHGWGGIFYFKNDISISERVWTEETQLD